MNQRSCGDHCVVVGAVVGDVQSGAATGDRDVKGQITDLKGGLALVDANGEEAVTWGFAGLMKHWNEKHAHAAYVPSIFRGPPPEYAYGAQILLCEKTDFILFLKAFSAGVIVYDPAIKMEEASSAKPDFKKRNQFRVKHGHLTDLYSTHETVSVAS